MVWPGTKLRLDAVGRWASDGYTVKKPLAVGWVAVTLITTAVAPAGTVVCPPVTATARSSPGPNGLLVFRVSRMRLGVSGKYVPCGASVSVAVADLLMVLSVA